MPEICRFYGLVMTMYWNDHQPPHFHVRYGEWQAEIDNPDTGIIAGQSATPRARPDHRMGAPTSTRPAAPMEPGAPATAFATHPASGIMRGP